MKTLRKDSKKTGKINEINEDPFEEYIRLGEPDKADKAYVWQTAVGLQDVDRLQPSEYLLDTAKENIDGNISIDEVKKRIDSYYRESANHVPEGTEEADKVAVHIAEILSDSSFVFSPAQYVSIHRRLFTGVYSHAGMSFLEIFLRNLLMGEHNELKNRYMHIRWEETTHSRTKQHIEQHIGQHIQEQNSILNLLDTKEISSKMKSNITKMYDAFGMEKIFGRSDVIKVLGITERPASTLLGKMYSLGLTEKITGAGKGKYRFIV